jgi:hypothetical protein
MTIPTPTDYTSAEAYLAAVIKAANVRAETEMPGCLDSLSDAQILKRTSIRKDVCYEALGVLASAYFNLRAQAPISFDEVQGVCFVAGHIGALGSVD